MAIFRGHYEGVLTIDLSKVNNNILVSSGRDTLIKVWDMKVNKYS